MLRPFMESDTDALVRLWLESARASHAFLPQSMLDCMEEDIRTLYLPMCDEVLLHVDDATGDIDAFIAFSGDYLGALFVAPHAQGRGLGTRMFRIARRMHPELMLTVYKANARAVAFYEKQGLRAYAERTEERAGCAEYLMAFPQASDKS